MRAHIPHRRRGAAVAITALTVLAIASLGRTTDITSAATQVDGNPSCESLGYEFSYKVEDPSGSYSFTLDGVTGHLVVGTYDQPGIAEDNHDNAVIEYGTDPAPSEIDGVIIVKGSDGAIIYDLGEPVPLHSPTNASGKWPTISHVDVCVNEYTPPPPVGAIDVTKVVLGEDVPDDLDFEICVAPIESDDSTCLHASGDEVLHFGNLQPGTYIVYETDPGPAWEVVGSGTEVLVVADHTATATITNTYVPEEPGTGSLTVTKVVETTADGPDGPFEICVVREDGEAEPMCESVVDGTVLEFTDLAPGWYLITEDAGANWTVEITSGRVLVLEGQLVSVTVTNTYVPPTPDTGSVVVTKVVNGDPTLGSYEICLTGPDPSTDRVCDTLTGAGTVRFDGLEPGTYTVSESDPGDGFTVTVVPETVTVTAGDVATATVTNTYQAIVPPTTGSVVLTKVVTGDPPSGTYELCLVGPAPSTSRVCETLTGAGTVRFDGLVPGTYGVTEEDPGDGFTVTVEPTTVTVISDEVATATVTNAYAEQEQLPPTTPTTPTTPSAPLPGTGTNGTMALVATGLLGAGTLLVATTRRRPHRVS